MAISHEICLECYIKHMGHPPKTLPKYSGDNTIVCAWCDEVLYIPESKRYHYNPDIKQLQSEMSSLFATNPDINLLQEEMADLFLQNPDINLLQEEMADLFLQNPYFYQPFRRNPYPHNFYRHNIDIDLRKLELQYASTPTDVLAERLRHLRRRTGQIGRHQILIIGMEAVPDAHSFPPELPSWFDVTFWSHQTRHTYEELEELELDLIIVYPAPTGARDVQFRMTLREAMMGISDAIMMLKRYSYRGSACEYILDPLEENFPIIRGTQWGHWFPGEVEAAREKADLSWIEPFLQTN